MNTGWIWLHRKLLDWEWYRDANVSRLFIHLLLRANHKTNKWRGIKINRGQLITGRKALARELGLSEMQIRTALNKLKSTNEITIETTNKYSVLTISNYNSYQGSNQHHNQRVTNKQPTNNQQITTNNNDKNEIMIKNEKKRYTSPKDITEEDLKEISEKYKVGLGFVKLQLEKMENWLEAKGKTYKNYKRALMSWVLRDMQQAIERRSENVKRGVDARNIK